MQTLHLRNMLSVFGAKKLSYFFCSSLCVLFFWSTDVAAQKKFKKKVVNLQNYERKPFHFGAQFGGFASFNRLRFSDLYDDPGNATGVSVIETTSQPGFMIGFILNLRLNSDMWDLRFLPNYAIYTRNFTFTRQLSTIEEDDDLTYSQSIQDSYIELPIMLKHKSIRRLNRRAYVQAGLIPGFSIGGAGTARPEELGVGSFNVEVAYGFGFHFYMQYFNFAPEIRFSHGLLNMLNSTGGVSSNIDRLTFHKVSFIINFEG